MPGNLQSIKEPTLESGCDVFMTLRVCRPVYMTRPTTVPDARTVLAQSVFSTLSDSSTGSESFFPTCKQIQNIKPAKPRNLSFAHKTKADVPAAT